MPQKHTVHKALNRIAVWQHITFENLSYTLTILIAALWQILQLLDLKFSKTFRVRQIIIFGKQSESGEHKNEHYSSSPVWRAACTNRGPRKLPPIPTDTTFVNALPVAPTYSINNSSNQSSVFKNIWWVQENLQLTHDPLLKVSENCLILSFTPQTSGTTLTRLLFITSSLGALRATWSTDLFSVLFI